MFRQILLVICWMCCAFHPINCSFFCKDSTIDAIAYANDQKMYFIASGGHYWWIKETGFPPKDSAAKQFENGFKSPTAAVYIDGDTGCRIQSRVPGIRAREKEVWVMEIIDGKQKIMSYDTKYGKWGTPIGYDEDHCISKARVDFNKPIDAMFTRNNLEVFLVQGDRYAMVDCKFICTDPENKFGADKPDSKTQDFGTKDPIYGMLVIAENRKEKLVMFQKKVYYAMDIQKRQSINGKVIATKYGAGKSILTDFLRVTSDTECTGPSTPPPLDTEPTEVPDVTNSEISIPETSSEAAPEPPPDPELEPPGPADDDTPTTTQKPTGEGSSLWIIIVIIVIVLIVVAVGLCLLFAMRAKKTEDTEASKPGGVAATASKSSSKTGSKVDSKAGPSKLGSKTGVSPASATSKVGSTMSTRSGIAKSTIPKSSTGAVKSSASKK